MAGKSKFQVSRLLDERINELANKSAYSESASITLAYIIGFHAGNLVNYVGLISEPEFHTHTSLSITGLVYFKNSPNVEDISTKLGQLQNEVDECDGLSLHKEDKNKHLYLIYYRDSESKLTKSIFDVNGKAFDESLTASIQTIEHSKVYIHSSFVRLTACVKLNIYETQYKLKSKDKIKTVLTQARSAFSANSTSLKIHLSNSSFSTNKVLGVKDPTEDLYDSLDAPRDSDQMGDYLPQLSKKEKLELVKKWRNKVKAQRDSLEFVIENDELSISDDEKLPDGYYKHKIEIFTYIHVRDSQTKTLQTLLFGVRKQFDELERILLLVNVESIASNELKPCSFKPTQLGHLVSTVYAISDSVPDYEQLKRQRRALHLAYFLALDSPRFRFSQRIRNLSLSTADQDSSYLCNVHANIANQSGLKGGSHTLIQGTYTYHHYMQDRFNDSGWGCAYRSLQTIVSWFKHQAYIYSPDVERYEPQAAGCVGVGSNVETRKTAYELRARLERESRVPSHEEIQRVLVDIGDKQASFVGSKKWIGSQEICFVLSHLYNIDSKFISVNSGSELVSKGRDLCQHFVTQSTPVMIGGGLLAHTIIGVDFNEKNGDISYLILDPHYTGAEDPALIVKKGWCGWKKNSFWDKSSFYNLCLAQRPKVY